MRPKLFMIPGALVIALEPPAIQGIGSFGGFQYELQDRGGNTLADLDRVAHTIVAQGSQRKNLTGFYTSFTSNDPQVLVNIDREKAKAMGVPFNQIADALGVYMGSEYVNNFDFNNRSYRVDVQADQQFRQTAADIRQFYVRSNTGQMIPLDNLVTLQQTSGPQVISHYNLFRSAEIDGSAAPGQQQPGTHGDGRPGKDSCCRVCRTNGRGWRSKRPSQAERPCIFSAWVFWWCI